MLKQLTTAGIAGILMLGSANAALVTNNINLGETIGDTGVLNGNDEFEFRITPFGLLEIDAAGSASGDFSDLAKIKVRLDLPGMADDEETMLDITDVDGLDFGGFEFERFTASETFSIFVSVIDPVNTDTPFTISLRASADRPGIGDEVPVPAAGLLMVTALGGFAAARRRRAA